MTGLGAYKMERPGTSHVRSSFCKNVLGAQLKLQSCLISAGQKSTTHFVVKNRRLLDTGLDPPSPGTRTHFVSFAYGKCHAQSPSQSRCWWCSHIRPGSIPTWDKMSIKWLYYRCCWCIVLQNDQVPVAFTKKNWPMASPRKSCNR